MDYPLKILRKHLANEKAWLNCTVHDAKSAAGKKMAQARVPQLEKAIEVLTQETSSKTKEKTKAAQPPLRPERAGVRPKTQLSLWQLMNP